MIRCATGKIDRVVDVEKELVILVNEENEPIGTCDKADVHHDRTPLHRAFSCFLFNDAGQILLQQRAESKKTWPNIWSNSCCGHPLPKEDLEAAVRRRLKDELGLSEIKLKIALPDYRYRAEYLGVVENEFCPVWIGHTNQAPSPNPEEVRSTQWVPWDQFKDGIRTMKSDFFINLSPWCKEETLLLEQSRLIPRFLSEVRK